jgi:hypothetical protein
MSAMNDLDLQLKEREEFYHRMAEEAVEGLKTIQAVRQQLSGNNNDQAVDEQPKRNPVQDKITIRQLLAKKCQEGYTEQVKELLHKFGAEKLSDVDPKDYENLYYSAEGIRTMSSPTHHALLSASSANRWLSAPPLPRLEQYFPHSTSEAAAEGTAAHALGEYKIHRLLGDQFKRPTSDYQSDEMESLTDDYASYVMEQYTQAKQYAADANISVEQKLDFSKYVPQGFGTGDCVIVSDHLLHIIDFKYGKGVRVEAKNNPQMKLYAIGASRCSAVFTTFDEVETTIFQPRMANISTWTINAKELMHWANTELKEKAELAFAGQGTVHMVPGVSSQPAMLYCVLALTIITSSPAFSSVHRVC